MARSSKLRPALTQSPWKERLEEAPSISTCELPSILWIVAPCKDRHEILYRNYGMAPTYVLLVCSTTVAQYCDCNYDIPYDIPLCCEDPIHECYRVGAAANVYQVFLPFVRTLGAGHCRPEQVTEEVERAHWYTQYYISKSWVQVRGNGGLAKLPSSTVGPWAKSM